MGIVFPYSLPSASKYMDNKFTNRGMEAAMRVCGFGFRVHGMEKSMENTILFGDYTI